MSVVLDTRDTQGQFALLDQHGVSGDATPLHRHLNEDEAFCVLDGEIVAVAGDQERRVDVPVVHRLGTNRGTKVTLVPNRRKAVVGPGCLPRRVDALGAPARA